MRTAATVFLSQLRNVARSRWILGYGILLAALTELLLRFGGSGGGERALLSLMNVVLLLLPLVSVVFGTLYVYHAREFIEMLLAQPVGRGALYAGLFGGLALPLGGAFLAGVGLPLLLQGGGEPGFFAHCAMLLAAGALLTLVFTALALCVAVRVEDRARGLGAALLVWLLSTLVYDGLILLVTTLFGAYPLEKPLLVMVFLNPVDLARVLLLLSFDVSALMGYTGAVYERFFHGATGTILALLMLLLCGAVPFGFGLRWFRRKDF
jgi:Cu-processing system permease protein